MMLETQHHLLKRGADVSFLELRRPGMEQLTDAAAVCDLCWSLYRADHELLEVEAALAPVLGIHLPKNRGFSFPGVLERVPPNTNPSGAFSSSSTALKTSRGSSVKCRRPARSI